MISEACATYVQVEVAFSDAARGKIALFLQSLSSRLQANQATILPLRASFDVIERLRVRFVGHPRG